MAYHEYDHNWMEIVRKAVKRNGFTVEAMLRRDPAGPDGYLGLVVAHLAWTGERTGGGEYVVWMFNVARGLVANGDYFPYRQPSERQGARDDALIRFADRADLDEAVKPV